ncbi:MAG: hypothetical protein DRO99_05200 [Candidatus Aenigmatarchaeota archaeon]|nr:MAG: hypothetical protein DRO99_05200 [Candidatus Aenigmarchaeota archaeon]
MAELSHEEKEEIRNIGREEWQRWDYDLPPDEIAAIDNRGLVIDLLQERAREGKPRYLGFAFYVAALNMDIVLDFTTQVGEGLNMYWSYVFQMPKWSYNVRKVSESMEVSPIHTDAYNLFIAQRNRLEGQIKQGLASAMDAVKDYELLAHDARRYKEILDYFREERERGDEHVLRSLFVDRVDAHTGEGYSMITMAKRWPTIITDFIRMGQKKYRKVKWTTDKIVRELDVSQAEATVLLTKDRLFHEWKKLFRPTVAERYSRIKALSESRKKSIDTYRTWLRPYVTRHKSMREMGESRGTGWVNSPYMIPAFGGAYASTNARLWVWKVFPIGEKRKPEARTERTIDGIPWLIDPYDDFVREWARKIEYKYRLPPGFYNEKRIRSMLHGYIIKHPHQAENQVPAMVPSELYYVLFDINIERIISRTPPPAGGEIEDLMINPLRTWIASQNVLLVHLIELDARDRAFDREIDEMIGSKEAETSILEREKEILLGEQKKPEKKASASARIVNNIKSKHRWLKIKLSPYSRYLFRPGPYESAFYERVVKMYLVEAGGLYKQQVDFWKRKAGVG